VPTSTLLNPKIVPSFPRLLSNNNPRQLLTDGLLFTILRDTPAFGVYFFVFYGLKSKFKLEEPKGLQDFTKMSTYLLAILGGFCGCLGWLVSYPFDVLKSRKQTNLNNKALSKDWWYKGIAPTLTRTFPVNMVRFTVFLLVKNKFEE